MKTQKYYNELLLIIEEIKNNNQSRLKSNNLSQLPKYLKHQITNALPYSCLEKINFASHLVLDNYHKLDTIINENIISKENRFQITSEFTYACIAKIFEAIDYTTQEYISKKDLSYYNELGLKSEYKKIIERATELIFILKKYYSICDVGGHIENESQKIFNFAKSLDINLKSREENLKFYLSLNLEEVNKADKIDSIKFYKAFDYSYNHTTLPNTEVKEAELKLKKAQNWKFFRSQSKKESEIDFAKNNLSTEIRKYETIKSNALKQLENEINKMREEMENLKLHTKQTFNNLLNSKVNSKIEGIKNLVNARIRKEIEKKIELITSPYDLFNIQIAQQELIERINTYKETFKNKAYELNILEQEIEDLFDDLFNELYDEYFN